MLQVDRRSFMALTGIGAGAGLVPLPVLAAPAGVTVAGLTVDYLDRPLGLESARPRLAWKLEAADRRSVRQSAYRVEVASSLEALEAGRADVWDSGRIASDRSVDVAYGGPTLSSRQRCFWRVRVWDEKGQPSQPSAGSWWEMGLLRPEDWQAGWIAAEDEDGRADRLAGVTWIWGADPAEGAARQFRGTLTLKTVPAEATLYVAAREAMRGLWVNGRAQEVPAHNWGVMAPVSLNGLRKGRNVIAIDVNGAKAMPGAFPPMGALVALLKGRGADGTTLRFATGPAWRTARTEDKGWTEAAYDDRGWDQARPVAGLIPPLPTGPATLLRRDFMLAKPVARARLYATALGVYEASLNGRRVGEDHLAPEPSQYDQRILYQVHDVTGLLQQGANTLGAEVSDGWYAGPSSFLTIAYLYGPAPRRLCAQLEIDYADGSREVIATGPDWRSAAGPVRSANIFDGERHDAREELPGWNRPGFDAARWHAPDVLARPAAALSCRVGPAIRQVMTLAPRSITEVRPGVHVVDFGQNFAGWARLKVTGPRGTEVTLRFAEVLGADGDIDTANLRDAKATDRYVLKGEAAGEVWEPRFTYHGFRYVQMTGFPGRPGRDALEGVVAHSDAPVTGRIELSDETVQQVCRNALWSQRSNFVGIPTDCPQRNERMGWMGDAQVFWDAAAFNMDVDGFTRRFLGDVRVAQGPTGAYPDVTPFFPGQAWGSPGWGDAGVILPWTLYERYGDTAVIDENWDAMSRWIGYVAGNNPDLIWRNARGADYGDWLAVDAKNPGDPTTPKDLVGTAFFARSTDLLARMAAASGRQAEARRLSDLHGRIAAAFAAAFVRPDGMIGNGSQTSAVLALRFGLVPEGLRATAAGHLAAEIRGRGTKLSTGFLGTPYLLDALTDHGQGELACALLLQTDYPSWGYMVKQGATTMWERWNGDRGDVAMNSFNHYAFGAVAGFVFRRIAGIAPAEPGFARILVRPTPDPRLRFARADYESVRGRVSVQWSRGADGAFTLDVVIPANAAATVELPVPRAARLTEAGRALAGRRDLSVAAVEDQVTRVEIGSGSWQFRAV
jgi:alpha-L-rhamnosidase